MLSRSRACAEKHRIDDSVRFIVVFVFPTLVFTTLVFPTLVSPTLVSPTLVFPTCVFPTLVFPNCVFPTFIVIVEKTSSSTFETLASEITKKQMEGIMKEVT